ncbi:asparaginase [Microaerobacter geothermalis]|uniref:asparaginase n=1 Tax=Microaerobacter geothermalis TaxID=674972 RepID=UPI001F39A434|nr:asparaginase [Microaerobacter geothermalis]MCF6093514.1 asparaginase [Microaerobacter geothermalis]
MKHIVVINTGGTIAMVENVESKSVMPMDDKALETFLPLFKDYAKVTMDNFMNLPSPHITPEMMYQLSKRILHYVSKPEIEGVVITHGTDTLEETAYFLDLTVETNKPIVMTGAMRSFNELGYDGPLNLLNSIRVAANSESMNKGVLVVFNDEIHSAKHVTKTHTSNVATFQSPGLGPLGTISKKTINYQHRPLHQEKYRISSITSYVPLIKVAAGMDSRILLSLVDQSPDGLVIEALGQGNVPPAMLKGLQVYLDRKIPVVMVSRCFNGIVQDIYGYQGGGKQMKEMGVIFANGINGQKARIKLMVALQVTKKREELEKIFSN